YADRSAERTGLCPFKWAKARIHHRRHRSVLLRSLVHRLARADRAAAGRSSRRACPHLAARRRVAAGWWRNRDGRGTCTAVTSWSGRSAAILALLYLLLALHGLGTPDIVGDDEAREVGIVQDVAAGHWLLPRFNGELLPDKPILYHWLA